MEQLLLFPEVDYEATKDKVDSILLQAKRYRKTLQDDPRIQAIERALSILNQTEKEIIERSYFNNEPDYMIYPDLGLGSTKYYQIKKEAICMMAGALRIEVFKTFNHMS